MGADDLDALSGTFDVVTMIEVIEHIPDPVVTLRRVRSLLRPGGLLLLTTGNAAPFRRNLARSAVRGAGGARGLLRAGDARPRAHESGVPPGVPGHVPVSRLVDRRFGVTAHPVGWAVE